MDHHNFNYSLISIHNMLFIAVYWTIQINIITYCIKLYYGSWIHNVWFSGRNSPWWLIKSGSGQALIRMVDYPGSSETPCSPLRPYAWQNRGSPSEIASRITVFNFTNGTPYYFRACNLEIFVKLNTNQNYILCYIIFVWKWCLGFLLMHKIHK